MYKNKIKISICINVLVFILTVIASIIMFTGFKFMHGYEPLLESTKIVMLRFFTVQSNMLMGIVSLILAKREIQLLNGKIDDIPLKDYILKLMATSAVGLTFFVVFAYLGPISEHGIPSMLMNSNLFFHLIIPLLSILNFIIFEKTNKLKFKHTFYGLVPTVVYELYYLTNVLIHMENGKVSPIYDWYWFAQNGVWTAVIVAPMMIAITYIITIIIWKFNKKDKTLNITKLARILKNDGVICVPTDTVYGLCARIYSKAAYNKLIELKERPVNKAFPVMCANEEQIRSIAIVNDKAEKIIKNFMPGPITLVLKRNIDLPEYITNGKDTIAIRMASSKKLEKLILKVGNPVFMTSANKSGDKEYSSIEEIKEKIPLIDGIMDGELTFSKASTIIDCTAEELKVLREGPIKLEQIEGGMKNEVF